VVPCLWCSLKRTVYNMEVVVGLNPYTSSFIFVAVQFMFEVIIRVVIMIALFYQGIQ
jgi:hypothetical protein